MTELEARLCHLLQAGIPISARPFQQVASGLAISEDQAVGLAEDLRRRGIIRRFGPIINPHALGRYTTLVMAHVPDALIDPVADAINRLANVSHNYLRDHHFNIWFTLQADSDAQATHILRQLCQDCDTQFYSLPTVRTVKLHVFFSLSDRTGPATGPSRPPASGRVRLTDLERQVLSRLKAELPISHSPFGGLAGEGISDQQAIETVQTLMDKGVLRRVCAVLDHYAIGLTANALLAADLPDDHIQQAVDALCSVEQASHIVIRQPLPNWPYRLYAMLHATSHRWIRSFAQDLAARSGISSYLVLQTIRQLKRRPVPIQLSGLSPTLIRSAGSSRGHGNTRPSGLIP